MTSVRLKLRREHQKRFRKGAALNLVSLMDIFTILVFFLMVNQSEVEVLDTSTKIKLPDSVSEQRPENRLVVSVSQDDIVVQGRPVAAVASLVDAKEPLIGALKAELDYRAAKKGAVPEQGFEVTIMGDREIPYWLLKKIMMTCQASDYARISLAVNQLEVGADDLAEAAAATAQSTSTIEGGRS
jgi:biopolymer transport protein ExbD